MSLDQNLFTLLIAPSKEEQDAIDLIDPTGVVHYRKRKYASKDPAVAYSWCLHDPISDAQLVTITAPSSSSNKKTLQLHNPTVLVNLEFTGTLSFKWGFKWEVHDFEWRRDACFLLRAPDPPVQIAVTRDATKVKPASVQILDYNINRFDVEDRKGLELLILSALLTFSDAGKGSDSTVSAPPQRQASTEAAPPQPPKSATEIVSGIQAKERNFEPTVIIIAEDGDVNSYAEYCYKILKDRAILFITLVSQSAAQVTKVVAVAEATKRLHHRESDEEDLHQYVVHDAPDRTAKKGKRRIVLDDRTDYRPPQSLTIHLSKIPMPELQPRPKPKETGRSQSSSPPNTRPQPSTSTPSTSTKSVDAGGKSHKERKSKHSNTDPHQHRAVPPDSHSRLSPPPPPKHQRSQSADGRPSLNPNLSSRPSPRQSGRLHPPPKPPPLIIPDSNKLTRLVAHVPVQAPAPRPPPQQHQTFAGYAHAQPRPSSNHGGAPPFPVFQPQQQGGYQGRPPPPPGPLNAPAFLHPPSGAPAPPPPPPAKPMNLLEKLLGTRM